MQIGGVQGASNNVAALASKAASSSYFDPKDTNQDGVVSALEELAYSQANPDRSSMGPTASLYTLGGTDRPTGNATGTTLNLYA